MEVEGFQQLPLARLSTSAHTQYKFYKISCIILCTNHILFYTIVFNFCIKKKVNYLRSNNSKCVSNYVTLKLKKRAVTICKLQIHNFNNAYFSAKHSAQILTIYLKEAIAQILRVHPRGQIITHRRLTRPAIVCWRGRYESACFTVRGLLK